MAHATVGAYLELKHEAVRAVMLLEDRVVDGFDALFMTPVEWISKFDMTVVCDRVPPQIARRYPAQLLDRGGDWEAFAMSFLATITRRGMSDRATLVVAQPRVVPAWSVTEPVPSALAGGLSGGHPTAKVVLGLLLDANTAARRLDMGPSADDPKAPGFRDFWGPAAQLRRFPDGSVMEAVLWDLPNQIAQQTPKHIVQHVLERHAGIKKKDVGITIGALDAALTVPGQLYETGQSDCRAVIARLDQLLKEFRTVSSSFPLYIAALQGVSPQFRYTDPMPVRPNPSGAAAAGKGGAKGGKGGSSGSRGFGTDWNPALEVVLRFETSNSWPDDVVAIEKVKVVRCSSLPISQ
jgi:U3 small nucleolar RNA-associated protein 22